MTAYLGIVAEEGLKRQQQNHSNFERGIGMRTVPTNDGPCLRQCSIAKGNMPSFGDGFCS